MNDKEILSIKIHHHFKDVFRTDGVRGYMKGRTENDGNDNALKLN